MVFYMVQIISFKIMHNNLNKFYMNLLFLFKYIISYIISELSYTKFTNFCDRGVGVNFT